MYILTCTSLPRSGYHYLYKALQQASINLTKSHDFKLIDSTTTKPNLVLVRHPLPLFISWLELHHLNTNKDLLAQNSIELQTLFNTHDPETLNTAWNLIDTEGKVTRRSTLEVLLTAHIDYITKFTNKWFPVCKPFPKTKLSGSIYLLRYEDINTNLKTITTFNPDLSWSIYSSSVTPFKPRTAEEYYTRKSIKISNNLQAMEPALNAAAQHILTLWSSWNSLFTYDFPQ